jgi:GxxExxY protein
MPIFSKLPINVISQDEYHAIDYRMMGHAIAIQNRLGRLLPEAAYKQELAYRCMMDGISVDREVLLRVEHEHFSKDYFIDPLLAGSTIIEAKTISKTTSAHEGQCLNYLLLAGTSHGSLVNFRPSLVERKFLSTTLTLGDRQTFKIGTENWPIDEAHRHLRDILEAFCLDIGLGLDLPLYREAIAHLGQLTRRSVDIRCEGRLLGSQEMNFVNDVTALVVTALARPENHTHHLRSLLAATDLKGISWINLTLGCIDYQHLAAKAP